MGRGQRGERISILKTAVLIFIFIKQAGEPTSTHLAATAAGMNCTTVIQKMGVVSFSP